MLGIFEKAAVDAPEFLWIETKLQKAFEFFLFRSDECWIFGEAPLRSLASRVILAISCFQFIP